MKNEKVLVLRYGTNIVPNCIEKHISVVEQEGYCWFGKLGRYPSEKVMNEVLANGYGKIILYSKAEAYSCDFDMATTERLQEGFTSYYNSHIFDKGLNPSRYFRIYNICSISSQELGTYIVSSSKRSSVEILNKSMNSFFIVEKKDENDSELKSSARSLVSTTDKNKIKASRKCKYKKQGKCQNKSSVNYQYECSRPDMCLKQKV